MNTDWIQNGGLGMKIPEVAEEKRGGGGECAFPIYVLFSKSWYKIQQVFSGGYKFPLLDNDIYFFYLCCKTLLPTGNALRKHLATQTLEQLLYLPLYTRRWCKYTISGKTTEVLNASHGTIILPMRLVQLNSTPESCISKQWSHGILNKTPRAFLHLDSWYSRHSPTSRETVSSYKL